MYVNKFLLNINGWNHSVQIISFTMEYMKSYNCVYYQF